MTFTTLGSEFYAGWKRFWLTFTYPVVFVLGFCAAAVVSEIAYAFLKEFTLEMWRRL